MATKLGFEGKLFYNTAGAGGGGTWVELTNIRDNTLSVEKGDADVTTRATNGWRARRGVLKDASVEFEMVWNTADAGFQVMRDSFMNGTIVGIACLDGAIDAGEGLVADMEVFNFSRGEALEDAMKVTVSLKPGYSATAPQWVTAGV